MAIQPHARNKTRRAFIQDTFKYGAGYLALSSFKALGANDRIRIGIIGGGGRSRELLDFLLPGPERFWAGLPQCKIKTVSGAEVVAVADVYEPNLDQTAAKVGAGTRKFRDYRTLLDQSDIDAVIIASPEHWHKQMLLDAVVAGKDVYLEKPATHRLEEGPEEIRAVEKSGRIVQTGMQHRSWEHYLQGKQIVHSGALGTVRMVESYWFLDYSGAVEMFRRMTMDVSKLDWKAWLGPAPNQPFTEMKFRMWRYFWDFGGGSFNDLLTHAIDTIQWYMDSPTPTSAIATGNSYDFGWECPTTLSCTLEYPKGFLVNYIGNHSNGMDFGSIVFYGSKATLEISRAALAVYEDPGRFFYNTGSRRWRPEPKVYVESEYEGTSGNLQRWLDSIRSRQTSNANIRIGVEASRAAHIANAALRSGKKAAWDEGQQKLVA
jgi:predicted dehydrogenase